MEAFYKDAASMDGYRYQCKACNARKQREKRAKNPEKAKAYDAAYRAKNRNRYRHHQRNSDLKRNFGLTVEKYESLLTAQAGVCRICQKPETVMDNRVGKTRMLAVDHDHTTGKIRGLLCSNCNLGLGGFKDSVVNLSRAIAYLKGDL